jgi:two-component sensor histidine kinase
MRQTIRSTFTFDTFRTAFEGRMMALAKVHELLMKNRWETLLLEDIINPVLQPYLGLKGPTISVSGPKVQLKSDTAQALHLIFHELTTNAVKYGALSVQTGHLNVFWETKQLEGGLNLQISWQESGGPEVVKPNKVGFGSQLIDRTISGKLSGEVNSEYYSSGFQWVSSFLIK